MTLFDKHRGTLALLTLSLVGFTASFTGHLIASNLGNYMGSFGSSMTVIGLVVGSIAIAEIIMNTPFGILADRYGKLKFMLAGLLMLVVISLLYPYFHSPVALFTIRFMQGVAIAAFSTTATAIVADLFADRKGEVMGTYNAFKGAGYALGPILGGLVTQYFNFFDTFLLCAAAAAIVLVLSLFFVRESAGVKHTRKPVRWMLKESNKKDFISCYFIGMSGMLVFYAIVSFLPVFGTENGISAGTSGLILGAQAVIYVLAQFFFGKFADSHGPKLPIIGGSIMLAIAVLMIALVPNPVVWAGAVVLSGLGIAALWVVSNSYLAYAAPAALMGTIMGFSGMFKEVGDGGGPILVGFLGDAWGLRGAFLFTLLFLGISLILAFTLDDKVRQKKKEEPIKAQVK